MDPSICLEFINLSISNSMWSKKTNYSPQRKYKSSTPYKIINKIKIPKFERPKSALVSCLKGEVSKLLSDKSKSKMNESIDLRPWSKSQTPNNSRPGSSCKSNKKADLKHLNNIIVPSRLVSDTGSNLITEANPQCSIATYDETEVANNINEPNSAIQEYIALNPKDSSTFATEIPSFTHGNFPKRRVKHREIKNSVLSTSTAEFPKRNNVCKESLVLMPSYYHLKKRYYPIKFKMNCIPRCCRSPIRTENYTSFGLKKYHSINKIE